MTRRRGRITAILPRPQWRSAASSPRHCGRSEAICA